MKPHVVDANVVNIFQQERVADCSGHGSGAIEKCCDEGFIALDSEGHCQQEWIDCAEGSWPLALSDWIAEMMRIEKIQLFQFKCDSMFRELGGLGIPKKDHKWIRLARSAESEIIISDDIDLIDPTKKKSVSSEKLKDIKLNGKGPVQKYLAKKYNIEIVCPENFCACN